MEKTSLLRARPSANTLKLLALAAMLIDHCAAVFIPEQSAAAVLLRAVGRLTAPVMCFFIAEGFFHTSNLKKYMLRLFIAGVASHIPYCLCLGRGLLSGTSVMLPLLLGLIALAVYKSEKPTEAQKYSAIALCCALGIFGDWNYIAVLWILAFGIFRGDRKKRRSHFRQSRRCIFCKRFYRKAPSPL